MVNKNRLMGMIIAAGYCQASFAKYVGINKNTFNAKINNKSDFKTGEIEKICEALNIFKSSDKADIFLHKPSQNRNEI